MKFLCKIESSESGNLKVDGVDIKDLNSQVSELQDNPINNVLFISSGKGVDHADTDGSAIEPYKSIDYVLDTVFSGNNPPEKTLLVLYPGEYGTIGSSIVLQSNVYLTALDSNMGNTIVNYDITFNADGNSIKGIRFNGTITTNAGLGIDLCEMKGRFIANADAQLFNTTFAQGSSYLNQNLPLITVTNGYVMITNGEVLAQNGNAVLSATGGIVAFVDANIEGNYTGPLMTSSANVQLNGCQLTNNSTDGNAKLIDFSGGGALATVIGDGKTITLDTSSYIMDGIFNATINGSGTFVFRSSDQIKNDSTVTGATVTDALDELQSQINAL
jgi:hypothetical protein